MERWGEEAMWGWGEEAMWGWVARFAIAHYLKGD